MVCIVGDVFIFSVVLLRREGEALVQDQHSGVQTKATDGDPHPSK